jgi:hypothetical protein
LGVFSAWWRCGGANGLDVLGMKRIMPEPYLTLDHNMLDQWKLWPQPSDQFIGTLLKIFHDPASVLFFDLC